MNTGPDKTLQIARRGEDKLEGDTIESRLENLRRYLEDEGLYTRANTASLAIDALRTALRELDEARAERDSERRHTEDGETLRLEERRLRQAAEARLEEQDASWRETLRIERDARLNENRLKMKATARLEEAKTVLAFYALRENWRDGILLEHISSTIEADGGQQARAFLLQEGSE